MRRVMLVVMAVGVAVDGCVPPDPAYVIPVATPEEELQAAWRGRAQIDVESHPIFSTMQQRTQELSDGSVLLHYVRCTQRQDPDQVSSFGGGAWSATTIQRGQLNTFCCDRQFIMRNGYVETYHQVPTLGGVCTTESMLFPGR